MIVALNLQAADDANEGDNERTSTDGLYQMFVMSGCRYVPAGFGIVRGWRRGKSSLSLPRGFAPRGVEGPPAYILPHGNRDNDVPVDVAVSTIRKR